MTRASLLMLLGCLTVLGACTMQRPVEPIRTRADRFYDRGEYAAAAAGYRDIVDRYPGDWRAQHRLGRCLVELDRPAEALRALEVAHTRRPENEQVSDALAEAIFLHGDEERLYGFLRERAEATQTVDAYLRMARYSAELGDPDSARTAIDTAIVLDRGRSIEPYLAAAAYAEQVGDMELAVRRLRQAYGVSPRDAEVRRRLEALGEIPGPTIALPPGE